MACVASLTAIQPSKKSSNTPEAMPKFSYVAMDSRGKETKGTLDVANQNEAIGRLKEMGYFPTKVVQVDASKDKGGAKAKAPASGGKSGKKGLNASISIKIPGLSGRVKP